MKRVLIALFAVVFVVTCSFSTLAKENEQGFSAIVDVSMTAEEALRLGYDNLSDDAKVIFNAAIMVDKEIHAYHKTEIVSDLIGENLSGISIMSTTDAMSIVSEGLVALNLPVAVREALTMLSSGITAALSDGPLIAGDIYLIAVTLYAAVVVAENWPAIESLWEQVVDLFERAYNEICTEITEAFNYITSDIESEVSIPDALAVQVNDRDMRINGVLYACNVAVTQFAPSDTKFYPALIFNTKLWVCPTNVPFKIARLIMNANVEKTGVLTYKSGPARAICGNPYAWHNAHEEHSPFYLPHYHKVNVYGNTLNAHAWYILQ